MIKGEVLRYIDADKLKENFPKDTDWEYPVNTNKYVCDIIDSQPTADVVEVVECKDCKHRPTSIDGAIQGFDVDFAWDSLCPCQCDDGWYNWYPPDEWYCPRGERKTDAEIY